MKPALGLRGRGRPKGATGLAGVPATFSFTASAVAVLATQKHPGRWLSKLVMDAALSMADRRDGEMETNAAVMRVTVNFFKRSGKYYTTEVVEIPTVAQAWEFGDFLPKDRLTGPTRKWDY